jgi:hypothetical protein
MRVLEGVGTLIQLAGLMGRLCKLVSGLFPGLEYSADVSLQNMKAELFVI